MTWDLSQIEARTRPDLIADSDLFMTCRISFKNRLKVQISMVLGFRLLRQGISRKSQLAPPCRRITLIQSWRLYDLLLEALGLKSMSREAGQTGNHVFHETSNFGHLGLPFWSQRAILDSLFVDFGLPNRQKSSTLASLGLIFAQPHVYYLKIDHWSILKV